MSMDLKKDIGCTLCLITYHSPNTENDLCGPDDKCKALSAIGKENNW